MSPSACARCIALGGVWRRGVEPSAARCRAITCVSNFSGRRHSARAVPACTSARVRASNLLGRVCSAAELGFPSRRDRSASAALACFAPACFARHHAVLHQLRVRRDRGVQRVRWLHVRAAPPRPGARTLWRFEPRRRIRPRSPLTPRRAAAARCAARCWTTRCSPRKPRSAKAPAAPARRVACGAALGCAPAHAAAARAGGRQLRA